MSGLGRRTQYRKHLTDSVLNDFPEPGDNQFIARVLATRGGNQFEIETAVHSGETHLALLPTKFHKVVWVKRNDYVIVQGGDSDTRTGVKFIIDHILYKDQIQSLKDKNLWPEIFDDNEIKCNEPNEDDYGKDGIVYSQSNDLEEEIMVNLNHVARTRMEDSSEDDSEGE
jgi:translation initiation factor IF-1